MKNLLLLPLMIVAIHTYAQDTLRIASADDAIFVKIEQEAAFPGGKKAWKQFIVENLKSQEVASKAAPAKAKSWEQTAIVRLIIEKDGTVSEATVINEKLLHSEVVNEARRVILLSPKWKPGYQNGRPVRSFRTQPITFSLDVE